MHEPAALSRGLDGSASRNELRASAEAALWMVWRQVIGGGMS